MEVMLCIAGATLIRVLALAYLGKMSRDKEKACKIPHAGGVKTGLWGEPGKYSVQYL